MTKKRVVDFLLALTGGAIALVGYFYIEDWYYWVVALGGGLLMLIFLILMVRDGRSGAAGPTGGRHGTPTGRQFDGNRIAQRGRPGPVLLDAVWKDGHGDWPGFR